jgi:hypothetical protein
MVCLSRQLFGCSLWSYAVPNGPTFSDQTQQGVNAQIQRYQWDQYQKQQEDAAARERSRQYQERADEAKRVYDAREAKNWATVKGQGYRQVTFEDFAVDGMSLGRVAIRGLYVKQGNLAYLYPSQFDIFNHRNGIPLLTENAERSLRKHMYECNQYAAGMQGCVMTVMGSVDDCTLTSVFGSTTEHACIDVTGGWYDLLPNERTGG